MVVGLAAYEASAAFGTAADSPGATPFGDQGISAVLFYVFAYTFMNIGAFAVVAWLQHRGRGLTLDDFAGLGATGTGGDQGVASLLYYILAYTFMNIGAFAVVAWLQHRGRGLTLDDFSGLASTQPLAAAAMTVFLVSLMGVPPTVGFRAKYEVILAAINAGSGVGLALAIAIVVLSAGSAFYYLRVVAVMWLGSLDIELPGPARRRVARVAGWSPEADARAQPEVVAVAVLMAAATVFFGIVASPLFDVARDVGAALF